MTEAGRVALMAAVRRIASTEGGDRFESLSQRDIRLQLPAALSAVRVVALCTRLSGSLTRDDDTAGDG